MPHSDTIAATVQRTVAGEREGDTSPNPLWITCLADIEVTDGEKLRIDGGSYGLWDRRGSHSAPR